MAIPLILIGLVLIIVGVNNKVSLFVETVRDDLKGYAGFFIAILLIGALGAIRPLKGVSDGFLALVILVLILRQDTGIWDRLKQGLN